MPKRKHDLILNTTTSCFLCYEETGSDNHEDKDKPSLFSLRGMFRYLKVDLSKTIALRESLLPILPKLNVQVSLCQGCRIVFKQFAKFYQDLEAIKIKLGICLKDINQKILGTMESPEVLGEHLKRLKSDPNPKARLHARMVGRLRKQLMLKCRSHKKPQPRVRLQKIPDPEAKFSCNLCHTTFANKIDSKFHMREVHGDHNRFPCKYCDVELLSALALFHHNKAGCNSRNRKQSVKRTLNYGINRPDPGIISIITSGAVEVEPIDLEEDKIASIEPLGMLSYNCPYCSNTFTRLNCWKTHMEKGKCEGLNSPQQTANDQEKRHQCKLCLLSFSSIYDLGSHVTKMHSATRTYRKFICDVCQMLFNTKHLLNVHRQETHDKEWLSCKYCQKKIFSSTRLDRHYKGHEAQTRRLQKGTETHHPGSPHAKSGKQEHLASVEIQELSIGADRNDSNDNDMDSEPILLGFDYGPEHELKPGLADGQVEVGCQDPDPLA